MQATRRRLLPLAFASAALAFVCAGAAVGLAWFFLDSGPSEGPPRGARLSQVPPAELSVLQFPARVPLSVIQDSIDEALPRVLVDEKGKDVEGKALLDLHVERNGPLRVTARGETLVVAVPLQVDARLYAAGRAERRGEKGKANPAGAQIVASLVLDVASTFALTRDWHLDPTVKLSHRWEGKPKLKLGPFSFPVENLADKALERAWTEVKPSIAEKIAANQSIRTSLAEAWDDLADPRQTSADPPVWFVGTPVALSATDPRIQGDALETEVGVQGRFALLLGDPGPVRDPGRLPERSAPPKGSGFRLSLPVLLTWPALGKEVADKVVGETWTIPAAGLDATLTARGLELYPSGDHVVVALDYTVSHPGWSSDGRAYLWGRPDLDVQRQVFRLTEFDYVVDTWDRSVTGATDLMRSGIRETISERLVFPLSDKLDAAKDQANHTLRTGRASNRPDTRMTGHLSRLEVRGVRLTDPALVVDTLATGELAMTRGD